MLRRRSRERRRAHRRGNLRTKTCQSPPAPRRRVAAEPRLAFARPPRSSSLQAPSIAGMRLELISLLPARALAKKSMIRRGAHLPKLAAAWQRLIALCFDAQGSSCLGLASLCSTRLSGSSTETMGRDFCAAHVAALAPSFCGMGGRVVWRCPPRAGRSLAGIAVRSSPGGDCCAAFQATQRSHGEGGVGLPVSPTLPRRSRVQGPARASRARRVARACGGLERCAATGSRGHAGNPACVLHRSSSS